MFDLHEVPQGANLCPTSLLFPRVDSVPLRQHCKCRVTLWPKEREKSPEGSVAKHTAAQIEQHQSGCPLLLNQHSRHVSLGTQDISLLNTQVKPWLLNMHTRQPAAEKTMGCRSDFSVEDGKHNNMVWAFTLCRVLPYRDLGGPECFVDLLQIPWVFPVSADRGQLTELVPYYGVGVILLSSALPVFQAVHHSIVVQK